MTAEADSDFTVQLDRVFQGPMDLLLHLVREQEVEIHEVEIARVIDGYFAYLTALDGLDIEVAGDFLVMAATLMAIKSRSLLPREEVDFDDDLDPEDELVQRLIEYRRFKGAADDLDERWRRRAAEHVRGYKGEVRDHEPEKTLDLGELTTWDLLAVFSRLMRETLADRAHHVKGDPRPLRWYVRRVAHAIQAEREVGLRELVADFDGRPTREGIIGVFCALLELMKLGVVSARQEHPADEVRVRLVRDAAVDMDALIGASRFLDEEDLSLEDASGAGDGAPGGELGPESDPQ